jgi:hypothetical protein
VSKTGTPADREEILCVHLPYEIEMLRFAYAMLQQPYHGRVMANSLIECFCIHARNLIDFFYEDKKDGHNTVVARQFVDRASYRNVGVKKKKGEPLYDLYVKLNKQIAHITYDRAGITDADKIGPQDRKDIRDLIEAEIHNFGSSELRIPYTKYADKYQRDLSYNAVSFSPNSPTSTSVPAASSTVTFNPSPPAGNYVYLTGLRDEPNSSS